MNTSQTPVLPLGFVDVLPPQATMRFAAIQRIMTMLQGFGYARVDPSLMEFAHNQDDSPKNFRMTDAISARSIMLRSDMTMQVSRLSKTHLHAQPRPLRLCYSGEVLHNRASNVSRDRQFTQIGAELIGDDTKLADQEIICNAIEGAKLAGAQKITLDIAMPGLTERIIATSPLRDKEVRDNLRKALVARDRGAVRTITGQKNHAAEILLAAQGDIARGLDHLQTIATHDLVDDLQRIRDTITMVRKQYGDVQYLLDPVEQRGFAYQSDLGFTLFCAQCNGAIGRGGRYRIGDDEEAAVGFSLFMDSLSQTLQPHETQNRLFIPQIVSRETAHSLCSEGYICVWCLAKNPTADMARAQGCQWLWQDEK
ncbi:MAG: ATP phosphoribosyltransferase regulatory subunit, partial [Pseudomonadota bacterium]